MSTSVTAGTQQETRQELTVGSARFAVEIGRSMGEWTARLYNAIGSEDLGPAHFAVLRFPTGSPTGPDGEKASIPCETLAKPEVPEKSGVSDAIKSGWAGRVPYYVAQSETGLRAMVASALGLDSFPKQ